MIRKRKTKHVEAIHESTGSESESDEDIQQFTASFVKSVAKPKKSESTQLTGEGKKTETVNKRRKTQSGVGSSKVETKAQRDSSGSSEVDSSSDDAEEETETKTKRNIKPQIKLRKKSATIEQIEPVSDSDSDDEELDEDGDEEAVDEPTPISPGEDIDEKDEQMESEEEENNIEVGAAALRKELADMPFDEVEKLKGKIGLKAFNDAMYGSERHVRHGRQDFKRANRHRPMEMSSKIKVSQFREVISVKKQVRRDPRFDDLSGEFNETIYRSTYSFLGDVREREKKKLVKEMRKVKDTGKKKEIKALINKMTEQENREKQKERQQERALERKKAEQELVKQGKRPYFLKKSVEKQLDLAEKYKELKKSGNVEKYLSKKRKKAAAKDRKKLPYQTEETSW